MQIIRIDDFVFYTDIEKTREYYLSNTPCNCCNCRNLYAQIKTLSGKLTDFLSEFGIDICRPDESASFEINDCIDYLFVGYTVVGRLEIKGAYETDLGGFHIKISDGSTSDDWFPNEQTEPCFFISVTGISLPWVLNEPFPRSERFIDKIKTLFQKKCSSAHPN